VTEKDPPTGLTLRPVLGTGPVVLRPPQPTDVETRVGYGRHPEIIRMYGGVLEETGPLSREAAQRWYADACADPLSWVIEAGRRCVGVVRLHSLSEQDRRARLAIGLFHPDLLGHGIGTLATRLLLRHAFETMQLHRVDLRVLDFNRRAIRCYERCGFVREGVERESACIEGEWANDVLMGILEHEYRALASTWAF
jgi:ribosomal-protein-alanine N-acetyltransferase